MLTLRLTFESFRFAWDALKSNLLRTILSLLGVTVGIFSIISVFTIVDSLESNIRSSMNFVGDKVIYIEKWPWTFGADYPWWKYFNRPVPTVREYQALRKQLSANNKGIAIFAAKSGNTLKAGTNSVSDCAVQGVSYDYRVVSSVPLEDGRYFTNQEMVSSRPWPLLGPPLPKTCTRRVARWAASSSCAASPSLSSA
nr:ABC transporter permease [Hymenobacter glacialis]